jgi:hypothetical protein
VPVSSDRRPDANKNEDEIRMELGQLRDVWNADQQELKKLHKVSAELRGWKRGVECRSAAPCKPVWSRKRAEKKDTLIDMPVDFRYVRTAWAVQKAKTG